MGHDSTLYHIFFLLFHGTSSSLLAAFWATRRGLQGLSRIPPVHTLGLLSRREFSTPPRTVPPFIGFCVTHALAFSTTEDKKKKSVSSTGIRTAELSSTNQMGRSSYQLNHCGVVSWMKPSRGSQPGYKHQLQGSSRNDQQYTELSLKIKKAPQKSMSWATATLGIPDRAQDTHAKKKKARIGRNREPV